MISAQLILAEKEFKASMALAIEVSVSVAAVAASPLELLVHSTPSVRSVVVVPPSLLIVRAVPPSILLTPLIVITPVPTTQLLYSA